MLDYLAKDAAKKLYVDGYLLIKREDISGIDEFIQRVNSFNQEESNFELQNKQKGTYTIRQESIQQDSFFVDFLFSSGLVKKIKQFTGYDIYLSNYKHYVTREKTQELGWHRDTYLRMGAIIGPIPPPYKLIVYSSDADKENACTQILAGSHRLDLNSKIFDKLLVLICFRKKNVVVRAGDALFFDASLIHNRAPSRLDGFRSASIYAFVRSLGQLDGYIQDGHESLINRFQIKLNKLNSKRKER